MGMALTQAGADVGCTSCYLLATQYTHHSCLITSCLQFYLLDDRLCYTDEPGKVEDVRYIPLDRIPVRALPRGYGPQIGVTVIEDRQVVECLSWLAYLKRSRFCNLFSVVPHKPADNLHICNVADNAVPACVAGRLTRLSCRLSQLKGVLASSACNVALTLISWQQAQRQRQRYYH